MYGKISTNQMAKIATFCDQSLSFRHLPKGNIEAHFAIRGDESPGLLAQKDKFHEVCEVVNAEMERLQNKGWLFLNTLLGDER